MKNWLREFSLFIKTRLVLTVGECNTTKIKIEHA